MSNCAGYRYLDGIILIVKSGTLDKVTTEIKSLNNNYKSSPGSIKFSFCKRDRKIQFLKLVPNLIEFQWWCQFAFLLVSLVSKYRCDQVDIKK